MGLYHLSHGIETALDQEQMAAKLEAYIVLDSMTKDSLHPNLHFQGYPLLANMVEKIKWRFPEITPMSACWLLFKVPQRDPWLNAR